LRAWRRLHARADSSDEQCATTGVDHGGSRCWPSSERRSCASAMPR
jgi:hypothetical protein